MNDNHNQMMYIEYIIISSHIIIFDVPFFMLLLSYAFHFDVLFPSCPSSLFLHVTPSLLLSCQVLRSLELAAFVDGGSDAGRISDD